MLKEIRSSLMKIKKLFTTIALALFCAVLAFTQSANDLLLQGVTAEQKGDNIKALTLYIKAHTVDKNLIEAENKMNKMLEIVADGKFGIDINSDDIGVKSQNLIRLRNEWDKLLLAATKLVASNPPLFEAYYFNDVVPQPMKEEDYNNNTMSFKVSAPYLRIFYAPENNEIIHILSATLKKIEGHDVWGAKINGFPNSYFADTVGDNWLKREKENYDFQISLFDNSKKELASNKVSFTVNYDKEKEFPTKKEFPRISIKSSVQGKFGGSYFIGFNKSDYISEGEVEQCTFNNVSMENIDASSFFITAEYIGNKEFAIPITLAANDVAQLYSADSKKHKKIVGNLSARSDPYYGAYTWNRVSSRLEFTSIDISEAYGLYLLKLNATGKNVKSLVLPEGVECIEEESLGEALETLTIPSSVTKIDPKLFYLPHWDSKSKLKTVNYRGSERQWNTIEGHNNFGNVKINYLYEADKIKKEYITAITAKEKAEEEYLAAEEEKARQLLAAEAEKARQHFAEEEKAAEERIAARAKKEAEKQRLIKLGVFPATEAPELLRSINFSNRPGEIKKIKIIGNVSYEMENIRSAIVSIQSNLDPLKKNTYLNLSLDFSETEGLTKIEQGYFLGFYLIREITLPTTLTEIEEHAFHLCNPMPIINYTGTKAQWKKIWINKDGNEDLLKAKINYDYKAK